MIEAPANDGNRADITTTEESIDFLFVCRPAYISSSLMVLRMQFKVS